MITGFQATMTVNDGGNGAAPGGAATAFSGPVSFNLPSLEAGKFDATELAQTSDVYERELPTGLIKIGTTKCDLKFTKANYQRLQAMVGVRGYTFVLTSPDDRSSGSPVTLVATFTGFISMVGEVKWEKANAAIIPFEMTVQIKPTSYA